MLLSPKLLITFGLLFSMANKAASETLAFPRAKKVNVQNNRHNLGVF
jgi:hypothetical protein